MNTKIKTDDRVRKLVLAIGEETGPVPRRGLIAALGLQQDSRRNFYTNYLNPARARGLVVMEFPDVPSKPEQAYLLTEKGREYYQEIASKKEQAKD